MASTFFSPRKRIFALVIAVFLLAIGFLAVKVSAQDQSSSTLADRLKRRGVPVSEVKISSRLPFELNVTLQSKSATTAFTNEDSWNALLTEHELRLANQNGVKLNSYTVRMVNANGKEIAKHQSFLDEPGKPASTPVSFVVDNARAEEKIKTLLQPGEIRLTLIQVSSDAIEGKNAQILLVQGSVTDKDAANRSLLSFLDSFKDVLNKPMPEAAMYIPLGRARITDSQGQQILDYAIDCQTGTELFSIAPGVTNSFFPHPPAMDVPPSPALETTGIPQPSSAYPVLTPTRIYP